MVQIKISMMGWDLKLGWWSLNIIRQRVYAQADSKFSKTDSMLVDWQKVTMKKVIQCDKY